MAPPRRPKKVILASLPLKISLPTQDSVLREEVDFDDLDDNDASDDVSSKPPTSDPIAIASPRKNSKDMPLDQVTSLVNFALYGYSLTSTYRGF